MNLEKINTAAWKAIQSAKDQNTAVCLTIIDEGGHVVYQARMGNANFMTNEVSYRKAKTAFLFKCPSHVLRSITEKIPVLHQTIQQVPGDPCMLEGGLPLTENNRVIGGVGVSGGNFEQDLLIADSFVKSLNELQDGN